MNKFLIIVLVVLSSCSGEKNDRKNPLVDLSKEERNKISQNSLRKTIKKEQEQISAYIKRKGGVFKESPTGVHSYIYQDKNEGTGAKEGQLATIKSTLSLLKGDTVHVDKTENFVIAFQEKESGLHESIKKLTVGDKAIIIIPSYMAHGLTGDDDKIPPLSSLVYNIELLNLK